MSICKIFVPYPAVGMGISRQAFENGIAMRPDIISADAGSTDSGPYYLGTGSCKYAREALKADMRPMLVAAKRLGIPVTVGSCGTCGTDTGVDEMAAICREISAEEGISCKIAKIYSQQDAATLKSSYRAGKIHPLYAAPEITEETFDECSNIVALAGTEPFSAALEAGADVVLCGRATDTAVIAAMPIMKGCNVAAAWHGAKTAECGALCTADNSLGGGVFLTIDDDGFTIEPTADGNRCTVTSVAAHLLYENADPFYLTEPSGTIDTTASRYVQLDERRVRVTGTTFKPASQYTMKLEGAAPAGYQTISLVGITDRQIMRRPTIWLDALKEFAQERLDNLGLPHEYSYALKPYGWNAVTDEEVPVDAYTPRELGLLLVVTASTQALATKVAKLFNPLLLHFPVKKDGPLPSFAFPFSPAEIERGLIYEFRLNHIIDVDDPLALVRIVYENIG